MFLGQLGRSCHFRQDVLRQSVLRRPILLHCTSGVVVGWLDCPKVGQTWSFNEFISNTIGNRKRDCAWGCARGIKYHLRKSADRKAQISPVSGKNAWFVLFDLQIFSGVFIPRAQPHAQSLFLFPFFFAWYDWRLPTTSLCLFRMVFGIKLIHFFDEKKDGAAGSFVSVLRSPVTPFHRSKTKNANCFEERNVFGNGKCELSTFKREKLRCKFLAGKSAKLFANTKVQIFGKERCKIHRQFQRY